MRFAFAKSVLAPLAAAAAALCALGAPAQGAEVRDVRIAETGGALTRLVIETDRPLDYSHFTLAEGGMRLVLDLERVDWRIAGQPAGASQQRAAGAGLVAQYRFAHHDAQTSRLVLDLSAPAEVVSSFVLPAAAAEPNTRMVFDLAAIDYQRFAEGAGFRQFAENGGDPVAQGDAALDGLPEARITSAGGLQPAGKPLIVVDAGHGGRDPGALGASRQEKRVNLDAALALRELLQATGRYDVVLTRSSDVFLELEERVEIARDSGADLFISLHADAAANRSAQGASVYTLDARGQSRTRQKMASDAWEMDATRSVRDRAVGEILVDLSITDTKNQSVAFAETLRQQVSQVAPMVQNPHREANFYVLLAPDVPAVLLEMGFMTNRVDEANLSSPTYLRSLMQSVAGAIDSYFSSGDRRYAAN